MLKVLIAAKEAALSDLMLSEESEAEDIKVSPRWRVAAATAAFDTGVRGSPSEVTTRSAAALADTLSFCNARKRGCGHTSTAVRD